MCSSDLPIEMNQINHLKNDMVSYLTSHTGIQTKLCHHMMLWPNHMQDIVVAGGAFADVAHNRIPKDIDVFILNGMEPIWTALASLFFENDTHIFTTNPTPRPGVVYHHRGSLVYHGGNYFKDNPKIIKTVFDPNTKIQLIFTTYQTRQALLSHIDFKHCCVSMELFDQSNGSNLVPKLFITRSIFDSIVNKTLVLNRADGLVKNWRKDKYLKRGYSDATNVGLRGVSPVPFMSSPL